MLSTNSAVSLAYMAVIWLYFYQAPRTAKWWQSYLANTGHPSELVQNSQASSILVDSHDACIGRGKKLSLTSFSFSDEWTSGQKEHFIQGHRLVGSVWDFPSEINAETHYYILKITCLWIHSDSCLLNINWSLFLCQILECWEVLGKWVIYTHICLYVKTDP